MRGKTGLALPPARHSDSRLVPPVQITAQQLGVQPAAVPDLRTPPATVLLNGVFAVVHAHVYQIEFAAISLSLDGHDMLVVLGPRFQLLRAASATDMITGDRIAPIAMLCIT